METSWMSNKSSFTSNRDGWTICVRICENDIELGTYTIHVYLYTYKGSICMFMFNVHVHGFDYFRLILSE